MQGFLADGLFQKPKGLLSHWLKIFYGSKANTTFLVLKHICQDIFSSFQGCNSNGLTFSSLLQTRSPNRQQGNGSAAQSSTPTRNSSSPFMCPPPPGTSSLSIAQGQAAQNSGQGEQYVSDCKFKG